MALEFQLKSKEFETCLENFKSFERTYHQEQRKMRVEVNLKVSADFAEEVSRLEAIFDRFVGEFTDDPLGIANYKEVFVPNLIICQTFIFGI